VFNSVYLLGITYQTSGIICCAAWRSCCHEVSTVDIRCVCVIVYFSEQIQTAAEENQLLQEEHDRLLQRFSKLTADAEQNERIWRERLLYQNCLLNSCSYTSLLLSCYIWARKRCRISPPCFLAECYKRQLNQGSFVSLYFMLFTFSDLYRVCLSVFLYCFVCQYQSSDWLWRPPPKWPMLCRVGH